MAEKRIERKDLVSENAILSIVKDLQEVEDISINILEINKELSKTQAFKSSKDVKEFQETVKTTDNALKTYNETQKQRLKLEKQLAESTDEQVKAKLRFQKANKTQRDELRDLIVLEDKQAGTEAKLVARNRQLRRERSRLIETDKDYQKNLLRINKELDENNQKIKQTSDSLKQQRLNVGNYTESIKEAADGTEIFGINIGSISDNLINLASNPLTLVTTGLSALVGLYASSTSGARDLASATTRLSTTFGGFGERLAKFVGADGDGDGLLNQLSRAFNLAAFGLQSTIEGDIAVFATNTLRELEVAQAESDRLARQQLDRAEELRQVRDNDTKSIREREEANSQLIELINQREAQQVKVLQERLRQTKILLSLDKENVDLRIEVINLEEEIADKQEENEGFRSEALTNQNSLLKEQNKLLDDQEKAEEKRQKRDKKVDTIDRNEFLELQEQNKELQDENLKELERFTDQRGKLVDQQLEQDIIAWSEQDKGLEKTNVKGWHSQTDMQTKPEYKQQDQ